MLFSCVLNQLGYVIQTSPVQELIDFAPSEDSDQYDRILDIQGCIVSSYADNEDSDQTVWMRRLI